MEKNNKNTQVTIDDVAKHAGVSKTTVSRYINGRYDMMSQATKVRIEEIIKDLEFRPSRVAQNLKSKHTKIIGCVIADITSSFSTYLVKGVSDVCSRNNYQLLIVNTDNDSKKEVDAIRSLLDSRVDGLVINTTGHNDDFIMSVKNSGIPVVMADRYLDNDDEVDTITSTNYQSSFECNEFLHKQGYDDVYFVGQSLGNNRIRAIRYQAYIDSMKAHGHMNPEELSYFVGESNIEDEIKDLIINTQKRSAGRHVVFFAVNGMILIELVVAMKELGLKIGVDFGVCGFDDWRWASIVEPGITTIRQDTYLIGVKSVERLLERIKLSNKLDVELMELPTKLMVRGSTTIAK